MKRRLIAAGIALALATAGGFAYALTKTAVPATTTPPKNTCKEQVHLPNHWVISFAQKTLEATFARAGQAPFATAAAIAGLYSPEAWQAAQNLQQEVGAGAKDVSFTQDGEIVVWDYAENATQARWDLRVPAVLRVTPVEGLVQKIDKPLVLKIVQPDRCLSNMIIHTFWDTQAQDFSIQVPAQK
jgi:hypothetical protein